MGERMSDFHEFSLIPLIKRSLVTQIGVRVLRVEELDQVSDLLGVVVAVVDLTGLEAPDKGTAQDQVLGVDVGDDGPQLIVGQDFDQLVLWDLVGNQLFGQLPLGMELLENFGIDAARAHVRPNCRARMKPFLAFAESLRSNSLR